MTGAQGENVAKLGERHMPEGPCQGVKGCRSLEASTLLGAGQTLSGQGSEGNAEAQAQTGICPSSRTGAGWSPVCAEGRAPLSLGEAGYLRDRAPVPLLTPPLSSNRGCAGLEGKLLMERHLSTTAFRACQGPAHDGRTEPGDGVNAPHSTRGTGTGRSA